MGDMDVELFLTTIEQLLTSSDVELISNEKHQLESLKQEIEYMRGFLKATEKLRNEHLTVKILVMQIKDVVSEAENIVEHFLALKSTHAQDLPFLDLENVRNNVRKKIKNLMVRLKLIYDGNRCDIEGGEKSDHLFSENEGGSSSLGGTNTSKGAEEKVVTGSTVIGFEGDIRTILGKLCDSREGEPLEIISIVGAAGGGKTTLAREVYDHPLTIHTFEIRAWITISGDYNKTKKRNLLISIFESSSQKEHGDYEKSTSDDSDDILGEKTHIYLKGKKYLIVMDDIWDIEAWTDIQRSLPKECNGSKVLFTSRLPVEPNSIPCILHSLAPLSKCHSWDLLREKVFGKGCCPMELVGIGEDIAEKCKGLPLAIVAIAGILVGEDKTFNVWEVFFKSLGEIIAKTQDFYMKILELSYNHLPLHLRACFLYIGGFREDSEILVRELIWLWIAEGFIQQNEGDKSLEEKAKDYFSSLVDRNLIMVAKKSSSGGIKACCIHDLLRELCLKKAKEDNFLYEGYTFASFIATKHRRLFVGNHLYRDFVFGYNCTQNLRSFLCVKECPLLETDMSLFAKSFEFLRVLALKYGYWHHGITERGHLFHLRYLAILFRDGDDTSDFESSFSYLSNLETLNVKYWPAALTGIVDAAKYSIPLPLDIFKMVKLRHLYSKNVRFIYHHSSLKTAGLTNVDCSSHLDNLRTLHPICPCDKCRKILVRAPNLRKLGFFGKLISEDSHVLMLPDLEFLECLETLSFKHSRLEYHGGSKPTILLPSLKFPPSVTRLTLSDTFLKWEELSILSRTLPNLEVLKLLGEACRGQIWDASELEEGFSKLKYLRLKEMFFQEWNASEDQFPSLEVLVVENCRYLERIPIEFANLNELREIQVRWSSRSAEESAMQIQEERISARGDDGCIKLLATSNDYDDLDEWRGLLVLLIVGCTLVKRQTKMLLASLDSKPTAKPDVEK